MERRSEKMLSKEDAKKFLRICKSTGFIKFNVLCKGYGISQPALNKFINSDDYDDFISEKNVLKMCDIIYNSTGFVNDMYKEIILDEKIA